MQTNTLITSILDRRLSQPPYVDLPEPVRAHLLMMQSVRSTCPDSTVDLIDANMIRILTGSLARDNYYVYQVGGGWMLEDARSATVGLVYQTKAHALDMAHALGFPAPR